MQAHLQADVLRISRAQVRDQLLKVGVVAVSFRLSGQQGARSGRLQMEDAEGILVQAEQLGEPVARMLAAHVDAAAPGWDQGEGGRSEINWAVQFDALDHRHYDFVRIERNRVLKGESASDQSGDSLAEAASAAVLVAMGDLAPRHNEKLLSMRDGIARLVQAARNDQLRFLSGAQRGLLVDAVVGNLLGMLDMGDAEEWIENAARFGRMGLEHLPDSRLVQELGPFSLEVVVDGLISNPERNGSTRGGDDDRARQRAALAAILTLPRSVEALEGLAEEDLDGGEMLASLQEGEFLSPRQQDETHVDGAHAP